jgi:tetratricopeptide (TPR) repeat protein
VISYARGDVDKAVVFLQNALKQDMALNMKFFMTSRVFLPLLSEGGYSPQKFYDALRSGYADAYKLMIMIEFSRDRFSEVAAMAKTGAGFSGTDDDHAFFAYFLGLAALRAGQLSAAGIAFEECLKADSEHPEALAAMGVVLTQAGRQDLASGFMARAQLAKAKRGTGLPKPQDFKMRVF